MWKNIKMTNHQEDEKNTLNSKDSDPKMNRGFELLLRNKKRRETPKTFRLKFGKMVSFFKREFHFFLYIHFDVRKKES
jgi:hypothetical protein